MRYLAYSTYLRERYGEKVYKLPVNISASCPNRDGAKGIGGCTFCGEKGTGFENLSDKLSVTMQLQQNMDYIGKRYGAKKFIAYFQNFTNTYLPYDQLKECIQEACRFENLVEIAISTRPDCVSQRYLEMIRNIAIEAGVETTLELGLQSVNYHTLEAIHRGHTLAEFIDSVIRAKALGFQVCAHMVLNLPGDSRTDAVEGAKILTSLGVDHVKLHSLYIEKNTEMCRQYEAGELAVGSLDEYVERVILFLRHLGPKISVQRLVSRAPQQETVFCNWDTSWWKVRDKIEGELERLEARQGDKCNYLDLDYEKMG